MIKFNQKILIIGGGAVAQCAIPLILQNIAIAPGNIVVIDAVDVRQFLQSAILQGIQFHQQEITQHNFNVILNTYLHAGDICIDIANEVGTIDILSWCLNHHVMYLNTNLNLWKNHHSINVSYTKLKAMIAEWKDGTPTAIISHGANPGLISSFAKQALIDSGKKIVHDKSIAHATIKKIDDALGHENFARIAQALGIRTIHISERDSQTTAHPKKNDEFLNTWSVIEFVNESTSKAEFAWGTHEQKKPLNSSIVDNNIFIDERALDIKLKSWVFQEEITGIIPPHDETFSLADYLMVRTNQKVVYRPTVVFVYDACPQARVSLQELVANNFILPKQRHVIKEEITSGAEKMGSLIMGDLISWWTGSILSIEQSNQLVPKQNATVMQVAAGVFAALHEMIEYPSRGICLPEDLNYKNIIALSKPYLGDFVSEQVTWKPNKNTTWEFDDFVVHNGIKKNK